MTRYTRDNPAPDPAPDLTPWLPRQGRAVRTETGWYVPPVRRDQGTHPREFVPTRAYFASHPDVIEVTWVAPVVCTGGNTHKHKAVQLGSAYRLVREDGSTDSGMGGPTTYEVKRWKDRTLPYHPPGGDHGWTYILMPDADRDPRKGSRESVRFTCPRCPLDRQVNAAELRRGLAAQEEVAELDVSKLA